MSYDLNLKCADVAAADKDYKYQALLASSILDDYSTVALTYEHSDQEAPIKNCTIAAVPQSIISKSVHQSLNMQKGIPNVKNFKQLKRITLDINDAKYLHVLKSNSQVLSSYDIIAVKTRNEKVFQEVQSGEYQEYVDILTIEIGERLNFVPKHMEGSESGIFFEINYGEAIEEESKKKQVIVNAMLVVNLTKGNNLILSSGCSSEFDHRSQFDLLAMGDLMGLKRDQTYNCLFSNPANCIKRALKRKAIIGKLSEEQENEEKQRREKETEKLDVINKKIKRNEELQNNQIDLVSLKKQILERNLKAQTIETARAAILQEETEKISFKPENNVFLNPKRQNNSLEKS